MIAFSAEVRGASFIHLQALGDDGQNADRFIIFRFDLEGDKLVIRELSDKFFKDQPIGSDAELQKAVEDNVENQSMYEGEPLVGTRQTK